MSWPLPAFVAAAGVVLLSAGASWARGAENLPKVLADFVADPAGSDLPDFSYAGYHTGESLPPRVAGPVFKVTDYGAVPDDGQDDIDAIQRAVDAAQQAGGGVVLFPRGTFDFDTKGEFRFVKVRKSGIVLRGAGSGPDGTVLFDHHATPWKDASRKWMANQFASFVQAGPVSGEEANAGKPVPYCPPLAKQVTAVRPAPFKAVAIEVASPEGLKAGEVYLLTQTDTDGTLCEEMAAPMKAGQMAGGPRQPGAIKFTQMVAVRRIDGRRVTLDAPLLLALQEKWQPALWELPTIREVGIEGFRMKTNWKGPFRHHASVETDDGWNHIRLDGVVDGWVRDVVHDGATYAVLLASAKNCTICDCRITGPQGHNGWGPIGASTYNLMLRLDAGLAFHQYQLQGPPCGNVFLRSTSAAPQHGIDCHGGLAPHNLFDNLRGVGVQHGGSAKATPPRAGRGLVLWNCDQAAASAIAADRLVPGPVVVGSAQTPVQPGSLYEFQRARRLGSPLPK